MLSRTATKSKLSRQARQAVTEKVPVTTIVDSLTAGLRAVGDRFAKQEIFLPEMMLAAHAMQATMAEIEPEIAMAAIPAQKKAVIVIGTVEGDMHEIGKDIAITMLKVAGFEVHDLGADVNALDFVHKAGEVHADIIGVSALMTTTMPGQKEIIDILKAKGLRSKYHVILGGAPVTKEWVDADWRRQLGRECRQRREALGERHGREEQIACRT